MKNKETYEVPQTEVVAVETEGSVLQGSIPGMPNNPI